MPGAVTGYTSAEIEELHVTDLVPEEDTDLIATNFQRILEERQSMTVESPLQTKDGDRVPHEFTGGALEDTDGALRGTTGVGRDLTERKNAEHKLKRQNEQLEEFASVVSPTCGTHCGLPRADWNWHKPIVTRLICTTWPVHSTGWTRSSRTC